MVQATGAEGLGKDAGGESRIGGLAYSVAAQLTEKFPNLFITSGYSEELSPYELVKAVVTLMQKPTEEMIKAGSLAWSGYDPEVIWDLMLNAALK
jgi:hypothetical protein